MPLLLMKLSLVFLVGHVASAPGDFGSGDGDVEVSSCFYCLNEVFSQVSKRDGNSCSQVEMLSQCFAGCSPNVISIEDSENIQSLENLVLLARIYGELRNANCELSEDNAPGCSSTVLGCLQGSIFNRGSYTHSSSIESLECHDKAYEDYLVCSERHGDCDWKNHMDVIVSRGRRNACMRKDLCMVDDLAFLVEPGCDTFRMASINHLSALRTQIPQKTGLPGTLFDPSTCGLAHRSLVSCPA